MFFYDPIEGMDYIFDRYAYLGLQVDASRRDIETAIREKRAGVHTDRLVKVDENLIKQAERIRELTDQCAEILLNDDLRPLYIERLLNFRQSKPYLVSESGASIVSTRDEKIDLDYLLKEDNQDLESFKKLLQDRIGYSPQKLEMARKMYALDPETRSFLVDELNTKITYINLMEDAAWAQAGVLNFKTSRGDIIADPEEYADKIEREIVKRADSMLAIVKQRAEAVQIGVAKPPLLLTVIRDGNEPQTVLAQIPDMTNEDFQQRFAEKAKKVFYDRIELIREIANEKKETLTELLNLTVIQDLGIPVDRTKNYLLYLMIKTDEDDNTPAQAMIAFQITPEGVVLPSEIECFGKKDSELKEIGLQGCMIMSNKEVADPIMEAGFAAQKYIDTYLDAQRPADTETENSQLPAPQAG